MKSLLSIAVLSFAITLAGVPTSDTPTGFDNQSNGLVDQATHQADQAKFDEVEGVSDGLGPLYNAQSCRECHQNPTSGGNSQVAELRVGHEGPDHHFQNANIPIADGTVIIAGRTLVNDRAICPIDRSSTSRVYYARRKLLLLFILCLCCPVAEMTSLLPCQPVHGPSGFPKTRSGQSSQGFN